MKNICFGLLLLLSVCCSKPRNEVRYFLAASEPDSLSRHEIYEIYIKDTVVTGNVYSNFIHKDTFPIRGIFNESGKMRWMEYEYPRHKSENFHYGILKENGTIVPDPDFSEENWFYKENLLRAIDKSTFDKKKAEYFPPVKKTNLVRTVIEGDYVIEVRVVGWDTEDFKGKTTFTIKDKKSGTVVQQIKTNRFECNQYVHFDFSDCNFDGFPDLALPIGRLGNRMTEISDYYLFDPSSGTFVYSEDFTMACSGIGTEFNEQKKWILNTMTGGGGAMLTAYQVSGLSVMPLKRVEIDFDSYDRYDVEIFTWKEEKWQILQRKSITQKEYARSHSLENFLTGNLK